MVFVDISNGCVHHIPDSTPKIETMLDSLQLITVLNRFFYVPYLSSGHSSTLCTLLLYLQGKKIIY